MWKPSIPVGLVRYLYILGALGLLVGAYGLYWKFGKRDLPPTLAPIATTGGIQDRKSTRLNSSHIQKSRMPSSA